MANRETAPLEPKIQDDLRALISAARSTERLALKLGLRTSTLTAGAAGAKLTPRSRENVIAALSRYRQDRGAIATQ